MSNETKQNNGIPLGTLWGLLFLCGYVVGYFILGTFLVWKVAMPSDVFGWLKLVASSIGYLVGGLACLFPVLLISLYLIIRDRNILQTVKKTWPILLTIVYAMQPINLPGPIDELVVMGLSGLVYAWFYRHEALIKRDLTEKELAGYDEKRVKLAEIQLARLQADIAKAELAAERLKSQEQGQQLDPSQEVS